MAGPRESSFMPTIKCSMCAKDIEISDMGDHVCSGPPAAASEPTPPPDSYGNFDRMPFDEKPAVPSPGFLKPRALPPRVDTSAANRPFFPPDQLTPVSASPSRTASPHTPFLGIRSGGERGTQSPRSPFGKPIRSATAPTARVPSLEPLASGFDSPFPVFPTSRPGTPKKAPQGAYGASANLYTEPDPMYAPVSPRGFTNGGLLQRMNTIAPGPFDVKRKRGANSSAGGHKRQDTVGSIEDEREPAEIGVNVRRPSTNAPGHTRSSSTNSSNGSKSNIMPRVPRKNGYGGFGPPVGDEGTRPAPLSSENRSQTFPRRNESISSSTVPFSTSPPRGRDPPNGPDLSRPLPPRGTSLRRPGTSNRLGEAPPVPSNINLADEFGIGNPYHAPTESQSSDGSGYSEESKASSQSSPPRSIDHGHTRGQRSDTSRMDVLMADLESSMEELRPREASPPPISPPRAQTFRPIPAALRPRSSGGQLPLPPLQPVRPLQQSGQKSFTLSPESPGLADPAIQGGRWSPVVDPAVQNGRFSPMPSTDRSLSPMDPAVQNGRRSSPWDPAIQPGRLSSAPQRLGNSRTPPPRSGSTDSTNGSRSSPDNRPGTSTGNRPVKSKGSCRGCGQPITGKSIKSGDGRLTGRYHKECFVCRTCSEPFQTATFYVLDDAPYCERHYHRLNGSTCATCDRGIEGQYLETAREQKFHPGCLTCADCKRNLRRDYFEMDGRVYCERDAFRRAQQGRGNGRNGGAGGFLGAPEGISRMERRTTRLMMM